MNTCNAELASQLMMSILNYFHKKSPQREALRKMSTCQVMKELNCTVNDRDSKYNHKINFVSEVGPSSTVESSTLESLVSDSEDAQPSSPPCDSDEADNDCATPSPKHPAVDNVSPLTDVTQVIGSPNLSASTRYSLLTNHFQPPVG